MQDWGAAAAYNLLDCGKTNATDDDTPSTSAQIKPASASGSFSNVWVFFFRPVFIFVAVPVRRTTVTEEDLQSLSHPEIYQCKPQSTNVGEAEMNFINILEVRCTKIGAATCVPEIDRLMTAGYGELIQPTFRTDFPL